MLEKILKEFIYQKKQEIRNQALLRNYLKEYIQYLVLNILYNDKKYKELVFKGGSCLRVCYGLPRLSEDLDFDYEEKIYGKNLLIDLESFLKKEIETKYFSKLETKIQSNIRLYLKFPILKNLGIADKNESDKLYVKIESTLGLEPYSNFDLIPISKYGFNFIVKTYDLPTLMAGKINAVLYRIWFKGKENEIDIKGRDFFDLFWFLQKGTKPNYKMLKKRTGIKNEEELKKVLKERIKKVNTPKKLAYDLNNFIENQEYVKTFSKNYLQLIEKYL
ncbi:MAG: nucleotidyl transferase AbiEii/AbiGii toxin family protein [Microgenomates group bacterium]|nr:nucleotidyl transferase AbiEii/AbiGii toxin family protein [Microgenomates group bacterium]